MDHAETLWEIEQIKQLKARYFRFLDTKQWRQYRAVFTDDAQIWTSSTGSDEAGFRTADAFVEWMETRHDADHAVSVHQGHMPEIEILGEGRARGIWALFDWVDRPRMHAFQGFGHYYEEYQKDAAGKWRIKLMRITRIRVDQMSSSLDSAPNYGWVPSFWPPNP
jgi:hypothetical protein